jgi:hypothetical protein
MISHTHQSAPTQYVAARGIRFAYRRFGKASRVPLVIIPTYNSYVLQQNLPNAQLILYPDANHGSFYQYPELFVAEATEFLDAGFKRLDGASGGLPFPALPSSN